MTRPRSPRAAAAAAVCAAALVLLAPERSDAHGLEPALLVLRALPAGVFEVTWKSSAMRLPGADVRPALPDRCRAASAPVATEEADRIRMRWTVDCGPAGLTGASIGVDDLAVAKIDALLRIEQLDGSAIQTVLTARAPSFTLPAQPPRAEVLRRYAALGLEQILAGPDHLFVLFGLLLLAALSRRVLQTIAAFTVGHSITLSAAALGVPALPTEPIELLIAISVLVLAVELTREAPHRTLLRRFPWAIALAFGMLHGLGFAAALTAAGLPPGDVGLALGSFNGGLELGQLVFVATLLAGGVALSRWRPSAAARCVRPALYAMGILAAFWCFERVAILAG